MNPKQLKYCVSIILFALGILAAHAEPEATAAQSPVNYALKFSGNYQDAESLNLVLVGTGGEFRVHLLNPVRSIQAWVTELPNGKFKVRYQIGASLPVKTDNSLTYKETLIAGEVIMTLKKPIPIIKHEDRALTLELEKYEQ